MINHMITHLTNRCTNIDYSDELILMKITLPFPPPRSIAVKFNLQSTCRCQSSSRLLPWFRGRTDEEPRCQALNEATKGNDANSETTPPKGPFVESEESCQLSELCDKKSSGNN
jgi:hypothetical protein